MLWLMIRVAMRFMTFRNTSATSKCIWSLAIWNLQRCQFSVENSQENFDFPKGLGIWLWNQQRRFNSSKGRKRGHPHCWCDSHIVQIQSH